MKPWHYTARVHDEDRIGIRLPGCEDVISRAHALKLYASLHEALAQQAQAAKIAAAPAASARTPKPAGRLTERMAKALDDMASGAVVQSEAGFSWPTWSVSPKNGSSYGCPPRSVLDGLHARGLLDVKHEPSGSLSRARLLSTINDMGRQALTNYRETARRPSPFKRFQMSFVHTSNTGAREARRSQDTVLARNENEAIKKLNALRGKNTVLDDIRIEAVFP